MAKKVSFSTVSVRKHGITACNTPTCRRGIAITLDWDYEQESIMTVNDYEEQQRRWYPAGEGRRTSSSTSSLRLTAGERQKMLMHHFGYQTIQEMVQHLRQSTNIFENNNTTGFCRRRQQQRIHRDGKLYNRWGYRVRVV